MAWVCMWNTGIYRGNEREKGNYDDWVRVGYITSIFARETQVITR